MHGGLLVLFLSLVNNVRTKFVEIDIPIKSNTQKNAVANGDDVVGNYRRLQHHHRHHKKHFPGLHHSLHSIENNNPFYKSFKKFKNLKDLEDVLPPSVIAAEKNYYAGRPYKIPRSRRKQENSEPVFHLYGKHEHSDSRRSLLKEAQDGLSSQEKDHPGISLIYLPGNPLLGAAKFPKRKPDDHSVYGNLKTLGLISLGNHFKEARAKKRPRSRPPDALKQAHLLFDPNHPGMTLVHPKERFILGYAKFSKPSESSHRVYGNEYNIGLRSRDRLHPLRFQYSGFRRNLDDKQMNVSDNSLNDNTTRKYTPFGLDLPFFFGRRLLRQRNSRRMNGGFSRGRYDSPRNNLYNPLDELSYKSLILRSAIEDCDSDDDEAPWRLPVEVPIKLPSRQEQITARKLRLQKQEERKNNIKPGWVAVLRNRKKSVKQYNKGAKKLLRNRQTIPPWVKVIEKDSEEREKLKPQPIPAEKLVYGHFDNLGIRYGNQPYRVKYSDFRKSEQRQRRSRKSDPDKWDGLLRTKKGEFRPQPIPQFSSIVYTDPSPMYWRRFQGDPLLKFTPEARSYDTKKIVDAVLKAVRASNDKNQHLYESNIGPLNSILNSPVNKNSFHIENNAKEIYSSSEEDDNINYRRSKKRDRSDSFEKIPRNCTKEETSSSSTSSSEEKNPGNPYTIFKNKYKQNWLWNHFMDGDHMNVNPYGPQFDPLGPSGTELFFGRKWWYFNQDDYRPFRRR